MRNSPTYCEKQKQGGQKNSSTTKESSAKEGANYSSQEGLISIQIYLDYFNLTHKFYLKNLYICSLLNEEAMDEIRRVEDTLTLSDATTVARHAQKIRL